MRLCSVGLLGVVLTSTGSATTAQDDGPQSRRTQAETAIRRAQVALWKQFPLFVWFEDGGAPRSVEALTFLRDHGFDGCNVEAPQSSVEAALVGVPFYIGHSAGKGDLHLRPAVLEEQAELRRQQGNDAVLERPVSLCDPEVAKRLKQTVNRSLAEHAKHHPMAWSLEDELSVTFGLTPFDYSFDEATLRAMRDWVKTRYADLGHLEDVWEERFESVDEVVPATTEQIRSRNEGRRLDAVNFASWAAHREFHG